MRRLGIHAKRIFKIIALLMVVFLLSGCWNSRELDNISILMGMGIDKSDKEGEIQLTTQIAVLQPSTQKNSSSATKSFWNVESTGENVFQILRGDTHAVNYKIYLPHNQVVIVGEDLAKEGLDKYLDYFLHDHETRLTPWLLVAKGKASDVLNVQESMSKIPAIGIADLMKDQTANSQTAPTEIFDFYKDLASQTTSPVVPMIEIVTCGDTQTLWVSGAAIFIGDKMVGELNADETRGLMWAKGKIQSGVIPIDVTGGSVELEIMTSATKTDVELKDGTVYYHINIEGGYVVASCDGDLNLIDQEFIKEAESNITSYVKKEIEGTYQKALSLGADIFGIGDRIYKKYPSEWKNGIKQNWAQVLQNVVLQVEVQSTIKGTGRSIKAVDFAKE